MPNEGKCQKCCFVVVLVFSAEIVIVENILGDGTVISRDCGVYGAFP